LAVNIVVMAIWAISMVFVYNHNYAGQNVTNLAQVDDVTQIQTGFQKWYNVTLNGNKIGYAMNSYNKSALGQVFKDYSLLRMPMAGVIREVLLDFYAVVDDDFRIKSFTFGLSSGEYSTDIFGGIDNGMLEMEYRTDGEPARLTIPVPDGLYFPGMVTYLLASKGFPKGEFRLASLDPFSLAVNDIIVNVKGYERIVVNGRRYDANLVTITSAGITSSMWTQDDGTVIKEEEAAGMVMTVTTKEHALDIPDIDPDWDILKSLAVEVDKELKNPRDAVYMKAELEGIEPTGFNLNDDFQQLLSETPPVIEINSQPCAYVTDKDDPGGLDKYLKSETLVQADDPRIVRQTNLIIKGIREDSLRVYAIADWVYKNVEKDYAISLPSAVDVLRVRRGDCNEHTSLFTALARAAGIPTKICLGIVYNEGMFYYHAWPAVYLDGCWQPIDPTIGQHHPDATHIMLLSGNFDTQASLMRIVGKLKVKILDYQTTTEVTLNQ
jgi:hypothetical protein